MDTQTGGADQGSQFDALLADIAAAGDVLAKSADTTDDAAIAAAAEEGAEGGEDTREGGEGEGGAEGGEGGDALTKALKVIGPDGEEHEAFDATDMIKSLVKDMAEMKGVIAALVPVVKDSIVLAKSLQGDMGRLGVQGRGRKAVVTLSDKPGSTLAKSLAATEAEAGDQVDRKTYLDTAMDLAQVGEVSYHDVNLAETLLNKGLPPPEELTAAVARKLRQAGA